MNTYILSKEESERLNILKYIAIILVVYIHSYATGVNFADGTNILLLPQWLLIFENLVSQTIARCGVPLFFLISSLLLFKKRRDYKETVKSKIRTLLVPYFIWNSFWILVFVLLQNLSFTSAYFSGENTPILQCSVGQWLELYGIGWNLPYPQDYPLWFMRDLMLITLCFPVIEKVADIFPKQLLAVAVVLLIAPINFPLKQALLWFSLGACIVKLQIHMTVLDHIALWKILLIYILGAMITLMTDSAEIDALFIFLGIVFWVRASKSIFDCQKTRRIFLHLSKWTFMIYVTHEMTLSSLKKMSLRLLPTEPVWLLAEYLLLPIIVIAGCTIAGMAFRKIAPKVYAVATGGR